MPRSAIFVRTEPINKISHDITEDTAQVNIFEDLQVSNMVRKPKVKRDANGTFLNNGARAKAGLNKSILNSMWGRIVTFSRYKGLKKEKSIYHRPCRWLVKARLRTRSFALP